MDYIMNQMDLLIPVLGAMIILTMLSVISSTVIVIRQNMHTYSIYYMLGMTWKNCVLVHGISVVIQQMVTVLLTVFCLVIGEKTGMLDKTVFSLGGWQLLGCLMITLFFIVFRLALSFLLLGRKSAKDMLREIE